MDSYQLNHPILAPLASDEGKVVETALQWQAPAILAGAPKDPGHLVSAHQQMMHRLSTSSMVPAVVTASECVDAVTRFHKIAAEHDGAPMPAWAQQMMQQQQQNMQQFQQNLTAQMTQLQQTTAKSYNGLVCSLRDNVMRIPNQDGINPPPVFPGTLEDLINLSGRNCNTLLTFYGLEVGGTVNERRLELGLYLGLRETAFGSSFY
ncbi:predicted protein [Phaeodactylum tricornutum CCAP 1055/1]|uniref:Uncharacterized protein n=1 Tax=Phaeodactylum tricornutum (strain CCAP 1055/1) TaxID=556484 RepID=B7FVB1_PHATC|nr:predicted protein [Phaeodactylum tricornutum CCAP 1055/1]EEC49594.1 predicted protein [Phaeodactylum tricornutum CCAP 1055/1]|eukprot:XP_002178896.1 predicted protein [Phaeodactylum tricornutum CCAP 1055/1]